MGDDRRSIHSIVVQSGLLVGLLAVSTTAVTAQMQQTDPPDVEVPLETMVLVGVIAAVGAFVGAFLANWYWRGKADRGQRAQQPAPQRSAQSQQPPQQRQPPNRQPTQTSQQSRGQQSGGRQPDDSQQSGP